ncbi:MAG TPA: site-specific integrase [Tepidisphaeraceae bacterium]|nr:site-specific integrase [Tepidisphaeraceae bacterium]
MASLTHTNGRGAIQFALGGAKRRTIRLGKIARKNAATIRAHVDHLVSSAETGAAVPQATAIWLGEIGDALHAKLAKVELVRPREAHVATELAAFVDDYIHRRTDLKPRTIANLKQCRRTLVAHFGAHRDLTTINRSEMRDWHRGLLKTLATATVAMHVKKARQLFAEALDQKLIDESPVKGIKVGSQSNDARQQYIPAADIEKVIAACPDSDWKLFFALSRYGGLRIPSEVRRLRWTDINWATSRMTVHASKTEHHQNRGIRVVPIFPELLPHLLEAFNSAEEGATHVITSRRTLSNPGTTGAKIVARAGLAAWPRLFQNLRASCETDLSANFPSHVTCAWIGNTEAVARKHYLMVTETHFEQATQRAAKCAAEGTGNDRKRPVAETQKPPETEGFCESQYPQGESNLLERRARETEQRSFGAPSAVVVPVRDVYPVMGYDCSSPKFSRNRSREHGVGFGVFQCLLQRSVAKEHPCRV